jgi:hypothetical protein
MRTCRSILIGVSISWEANAIKKETEKVLEYERLTAEFQDMRKVASKVLRLIIQSNRTILNHSQNTWATHRDSTKSMNYRKQ